MGSPPFYVQGIHRHARRPPLVRMQASKSVANLADAIRRVKGSANLIRSGISVDAGAPFFLWFACAVDVFSSAKGPTSQGQLKGQ
jgi:hypothetical protein